MATWYLVNHLIVAGAELLPGTIVNDAVTSLTPLKAAGGFFWTTSDANLVTAAALAAQFHGSVEMMESAMFGGVGKSLAAAANNATDSTAGLMSASDKTKLDGLPSSVPANMQAGTVTLASGTFTLNTGITMTASSVVIISCNTAAGTLPTAGYDAPSASYVTGGPGTGAFTVNARIQSTGLLQTGCTSTINYLIVN